MKKNSTLIFLSFCLLLTIIFTSCSKEDYIGDIVNFAPVTAVIFETSKEASGIVYRKVNDTDAVFGRTKEPVLIVYLDSSVYSSNAISFVETLADDYKDKILILRVNAEISDNPEDVSELLSLFEVNTFPCFAIVQKGVKISYITGYTAENEKKIISMINKVLD